VPLVAPSAIRYGIRPVRKAGFSRRCLPLIRERTSEGRKRAMAAGVKFGRKRKLSDYQRAEAEAACCR
jgi:DNA invertase Pin-like site-specific DNA recombinase